MGYLVLTYGGGTYTSVAWYADKAQAERHAQSLRVSGLWSGKPPVVQESK